MSSVDAHPAAFIPQHDLSILSMMATARIASPAPGPSLRSLPPEILEEIIILCTILGAPTAIAAVAQTCRVFHSHVYHSYHKHLWRQVYLVLFDDPRPARAFTSYGRTLSDFPSPIPKQPSRGEDEFPWEAEYKRRIWTANYFGRRTDPSVPPDAQPPSTPDDLYNALDTLLGVLRTAKPLRPPTLDDLPVPLSDHPHPVFPPFALVTHLQPSHIQPSRSIDWLSTVLAHGYPSALTRRLSYPGIDIGTPAERYDPLLSRLLALTGLRLPVTNTQGADHPNSIIVTPLDLPQSLLQGQNLDNDDQGRSDHDGDAEPEPSTSPDGPSALQQALAEEEDDPLPDNEEMLSRPEQDGVRRLARIRAYNMSYLKRDRMHGPFLPTSFRCSSSSTSSLASQSSLLIPRGTDNSILVSTLEEGDDEDETDEDYVDSHDSHIASESGFDSSDGEQREAHPPHSHGYADEPCPDSIRFDWSWIGAARLVVEKNLRDLLMGRHHHVLRALMSLDALRPGSSPGFDNDHILGKPPSEDDDDDDDEAEEKQQQEENWDWAGAEGQWRRCVCWMDYRDLIGNNVLNLQSRFDDPQLYEVMRIVPITMRIARYERSSWPGRPTIHVRGDLTGTENDVRLWGKVEMVGGGDIRWSLFSTREGGDGTWVSEGVQLGGLGSATGVLGMWTGADHEQMDPLGPFWAWKVGPLPSTHTRQLPPKQTVKGKEARHYPSVDETY